MSAARWAPALALAGVLCGACSEPADELPESWNTLHHRSASIDVFGVLPAATSSVRPLSGIEGSPVVRNGETVVDVTEAWWDRPSGSDHPDGAHVDAVRITPTGNGCDLTLGALFPDPDDASKDRLDALAKAVTVARAVHPQTVIWSAGFGLAECDESAGASAEAWGAAIVRAVEHAPVELVEVQSDVVAHVIRETAPDIMLARGGFTLGSIAEARTIIDQLPALEPLDVLTFAVVAEDPEVVAEVARTLRSALDAAGMGHVALGLTRFAPTAPATLETPALVSAHRGAWEMAARIALQDVADVAFAISDRGTPPSVYFDADGKPTPAFMARFPLRQMDGDTRVPADDARDLRVLATVDGRVLKVLVAAWDVDAGVGSLTYELHVPAFVPPVVGSVELRLAVLDAKNHTTTSFFFSDLATLVTDPKNGDVRITRTIPVPGVHYLEVERPAL